MQVDELIHAFLIDLYYEDTRLARTTIDRGETAVSVATAPELRELEEQHSLGPERVSEIEADDERGSPPVPDEWEDALREAFDEADIQRSSGSLVTKTIDGRDYYYLQWREGDTVTSKYVAPVSP